MNTELLEYLMEKSDVERRVLTEERPVLSYFVKKPGSNVIDRDIVVTQGQLMDILRHPRFVEIPDHSHNYVEMVYMYHGTTNHVINGKTRLKLETNDLLLLKQGTHHMVEVAGKEDIAVHFAVLPEFFNHPTLLIEDGSVLRHFICGAIVQNETVADYLHFHLQGIVPAQNLLENMIWSLIRRQRGGQAINQATMGILIMELLNNTDKVDLYDTAQYEEHIVLTAYQYLEDHYRSATLEEFSRMMGQPPYYISRIFKRFTKTTFKECLQTIKLARAAYLLTSTVKPVEDIIAEIGYENSSYFHKLFKERYGMTPKHYRDQARGEI